MSDFREVFDITKLTEQELGCLEYVLNSPAYSSVFEPYLLGIKNSLTMKMLDRSEERKREYPDDFLAGGVVAIEGFLRMFKHVISETRAARVETAVSSISPNATYTLQQQAGRHVPVLGANEQYDPAEDY